MFFGFSRPALRQFSQIFVSDRFLRTAGAFSKDNNLFRVILIFFAPGVRWVFGRVRRVCARLGADGYLRLSLCLKTGVRRAGEVADFVLRYSSDEKCLR